MPHNPRSAEVTDRYRDRLLAIRESLQAQAKARWPTIDQLDQTKWRSQMAQLVSQRQVEAIRVTSAYLTAFTTLETGKRTLVVVDSSIYAGRSRDGRPLFDALQSAIIGVRAKLKEGASPDEALRFGLERGVRMVGVDFDSAHRTALLTTIDLDRRFDGWQRAVRGTCGACAAVAGHAQHGLSFQVHPGCQCVSEPQVAGVPNTHPRLTGPEIFAAKSPDEQDEMLGPEAAELVRTGAIDLSDLVGHSELDSDQPGFITQRPVGSLTPRP